MNKIEQRGRRYIEKGENKIHYLQRFSDNKIEVWGTNQLLRFNLEGVEPIKYKNTFLHFICEC